MEQSLIRFGTTTIPYTIVRGRRQKTVAIGVDPVEGVRVRAPQGTPVERLDQMVHRKAKWIIDRRRRYEDLPPPPTPREFVNGETFLYLGRQYRLKLVPAPGGKSVSVRLIGGQLHIPIRHGEARGSQTRTRLVEWYRARASHHLPQRVAFWALKLGLEPAGVLIREQRKRWGSADATGNVRLNWQIVQAPIRLVDYVVAHELVHLRFRDHGVEFWATLGRAVPDYEERREALRRLGRDITW